MIWTGGLGLHENRLLLVRNGEASTDLVQSCRESDGKLGARCTDGRGTGQVLAAPNGDGRLPSVNLSQSHSS